MRNKLTALMISLVLVTALNTASFALGRGPGRPFGDPGERMMARIVSELGLSRAQKDKYLSMAKALEKEAGTTRSRNRELFDKIGTELAKDSPNRELLFGYMQQISKNEDQIRLKRMDQMIALRKDLTKEQKEKLEGLMKQGRDKAKKWDRKKGK